MKNPKKSKILVVDDDEFTLELVDSMLEATRFQAIKAKNGKEAIDMLHKYSFSVVITDLDMPIMHGKDLIQYLKDEFSDLSIIVNTMHHEVDVVIDIMRIGVFDYLVKPFKQKELLLKIERGEEISLLKKNQRLYEKERLLRIESQLEWFQWQNKHLLGTDYNKDTFYKVVFENLKRNLSQGAGFGAIVTLIDMILAFPKDENGNYILSPEIAQILEENSNFAKRVINIFSDIEDITSAQYTLDNTPIAEAYSTLNEVITNNKQYADIKKHSVIKTDIPKNHTGKYIKGKLLYVGRLFYELLINAFKFSVPESQIKILFYLSENALDISFINSPEKHFRIPDEYQNLIFEPFFRLHNFVNEQYNTPDYGLGLTIVEKIVSRMEGKITVSNVVDHTDPKPVSKIIFNLSIPLFKE